MFTKIKNWRKENISENAVLWEWAKVTLLLPIGALILIYVIARGLDAIFGLPLN